MLTPKLTNCISCREIPNLLAAIDCKIALEADKIYQNIRFMLNNKIDSCSIKDLLHYKRILTFKYFNPDYTKEFPIDRIANRVRVLTVGTNNCKSAVSMLPTTTTSTTTTQYNPPSI